MRYCIQKRFWRVEQAVHRARGIVAEVRFGIGR